ncbi:hypothetical protein VTK56DRAFT_804 [Thermocarpiscus australiensis]
MYIRNDPANNLNNDQWQALIALHRTLLHEHHDFFLASQHPSASPALRRLAAKYAMPARMWRHGIHSFLELLRHRLPASLDHMLTFIYMAYSMMALLYETVPAFENTWIECLGDLGRYRMAIEDDDIRDREVWTAVSRHWYSRASDSAPTTGRLYHHLAIVARPNALQQLYYYSKSLCVEVPFDSAQQSIMTLFEPIMSQTPNPQQARLPPTELNFVKTHGILFSGKQEEELETTMSRFLQLLDNHIGCLTRRWLESGYHVGISNICAITGYGNENNPIAQALKITRPKNAESQDQPMQEASLEPRSSNVTADKQFPNTRKLFTGTYDVVCRRFGDPNILPFLHVTLVFIHHLTFCPEAMAHVAPHFPWKLTAFMLNTLIGSSPSSSSSQNNVSQALDCLLEIGARFPGWEDEDEQEEEGERAVKGKEDGEREVKDEKEEGAAEKAEKMGVPAWLPGPGAPKRQPLSDDYALRGLPWVERETRRFGVSPEYEVELDLEMPLPAPGDGVDYGELLDAGAVA